MIRWIVETSLKYRHLVAVLTLLVILFGLSKIPEMPVDVFPEFEPTTVEIQTEALGLSADEVESLVTYNIEEFLSGMPWLENIRSESIPGLSSVVLTFKPGTDLMRARQLVQENLARAYTLPNVSKAPVMLQPLSTTRRNMMVGLSSQELSPIQMSVLAQWTIKPRLMAIPGVANVIIWGQKNRQLQVQIDSKTLQENNLTQEQIIRTTGDALWISHLSFLNASVPGTGGWIDTPNQRLAIRHVLPISSPEDLAQLPIFNSKLKLGDVANVIEGHPQLIGDTYLNGAPGLILVVEKFPWANASQVTKDVDSALASLSLGLPGLDIDTNIFRLSNYIEKTKENIEKALVISSILVIVLLAFLMFNWRASLISILSIPISIITTLIFLNAMNADINIMVIAGFGLAIGILTDDAIIDIQNIYRRIQQRTNEGHSLIPTILRASLEIRHPMIYATLIAILVILPIFFLEGVAGAFFRPLVLTYILALLSSLLVTLIVTPALSLLLANRQIERQPSTLAEWTARNYSATLTRTINEPKSIYIGAIVIIIAGLLTLPFLNHSFLPTFQERELLIEVDGPAGISLNEMSRIVSKINDDLRNIPGISKVAAHTGRAIGSDKIANINSGQIWAQVDSKADYTKTLNAVKETLDEYIGLDRDIQTYLREKIRKGLTGENEDIVVRIYGPQRDILRKQAEKVKAALAKIDGLTDLQVEGEIREPVIEVKVDIAKATANGVKPGDVRRASATIFAGLETGSLFENQKVFDVVVWGKPESRNSISDLKNLMIDKPEGGYVRLGDIADVNIVSSPTVINHDAISPLVDVVANVNGRDIADVVQDIEAKLKDMNFPIEYHPEVLSSSIGRQASKQNLLGITLAVAIGIYFLFQAVFNSWKLATLAFIAIPFGLIGGIFGTALNSGLITLGSFMGFLALYGLASRNAILLINHYQYLEQVEKVPFGLQLILLGARERLPSIITTALVTVAALLPFVIVGEVDGLEIIHPMASVILGGLITTTLLNLLIIPLFYYLLGSNSNQAQRLVNQ